MKILKIAIAAAATVLASNAWAFHSGGVAECEGCHTMHNSYDNSTMTRNALAVGTTNAYLLIGSDQSSTCLDCHGANSSGGYHIFSAPAAGVAPSNFTPGGDFGWLTKTFISTVRGTVTTVLGQHLGHSIVAADDGLGADTEITYAPGGSYPAANLSCISCHDPHGKYRTEDGTTFTTTGAPIVKSGSYPDTAASAGPSTGRAVGAYRILGGVGYQPLSVTGSYAFANDPPIALAPSSYNRAETSGQIRVSYGAGMSEWCANCHTAMHNSDYPTNLRHPAGNGALLTNGGIAALYNSYVASGNLTNTQATAFSSLVPFETQDTARSTLGGLAGYVAFGAASALNGGPTSGNETAMCLSCHRAHAGAFESMMRWHMENELSLVAGVYPGYDQAVVEAADGKYHRGRSVAEMQAGYYNRPATQFATYQRVLCNKCHAKD